jgi:hypothetical protein
MISQCFSAICKLGIVILAILLIISAISLKDALKAIGKIFLLIVAAYMAVCLLVPPLVAGLIALAGLLKALAFWLAVAVLVAVLVMLLVRVSQRRFAAHSKADSARG